MRKRVVGLEVTDRAIYYLELSKERGQVLIENWEVLEIPDEMVVTGEVVDISAFSAVISKLFGQKGCTQRVPITVGVSGLQAFVRKIIIPRVPVKEIAEIVRWEGENILPYPIAEVYYDYQITGESDTGYHILFTALRKERINGYLQAFRESKFPIGRLTIQPFGLINFLECMNQLDNFNGVLARVNSTCLDLVMLDAGEVAMVRTVPFPPGMGEGKGNVEFFVGELVSTLEHFHAEREFWLNTGIFIGSTDWMKQIRLEMPTFHWRHCNLEPMSLLGGQVLPAQMAGEFSCAIGLGFLGVWR